MSTLRNWALKMNLEEGVLKDVLHLMYVKGDSMTVSSKIEIDRKTEKVVGPHKTCQIGMARGLFDNWKQIIYYKFDQPLTEQILEDIIGQLWDNGYIVIAVVSNLGGGNPQAFKDYGIGEDKCFFTHPRNPHLKIFVFADPPHLLKLFRNH